jgi:urease accessory protein
MKSRPRARAITTPMTTAIIDEQPSGAALLRLLQLSSAALPIGMFAYSQGLEQAVLLGEVRDRATARDWVTGLLEHSILTSDVPLLVRLYDAWQRGELDRVRAYNDTLFASRGSSELRAEERQLGAALSRLLSRLGIAKAEAWISDRRATFATAFALAAATWRIPRRQAALGYAFSWAEAQVGAATRLVPLGQTDSQRVLSHAIERIAAGLDKSLQLRDAEIGASAPGQALLSALHETQYSRLFRS